MRCYLYVVFMAYLVDWVMNFMLININEFVVVVVGVICTNLLKLCAEVCRRVAWTCYVEVRCAS